MKISLIKAKLEQFFKKYYLLQVLKGSIIFVFFLAFSFFIFSLIESYFWLLPTYRSILFYFFLIINLSILGLTVILPLFRLFNIRRDLNEQQASLMIGKFFPEIKDKLLNLIQLSQQDSNSILLQKSIEQKINNLRLFDFKLAVSFQLKERQILFIDSVVLFIVVILFFNDYSQITEGFNRISNYEKEYERPSPYKFIIQNKELTIKEGDNFKLDVKVVGKEMPENVSILVDGKNAFYLKKNKDENFEYIFENVTQNHIFSFIADERLFKNNYKIEVLKIPKVIDAQMLITYPNHTHKKKEIISSFSELSVPYGSEIKWKITTKDVSGVTFHNKAKKELKSFKKESPDTYVFTKRFYSQTNYLLSFKNKKFSSFNEIKSFINIIPDAYPVLFVQQVKDSLGIKTNQFTIQISDDYGLEKMQLVYIPNGDKEKTSIENININKGVFSEFAYSVLELAKNHKSYELYFELFDNDVLNNYKKTTSQRFEIKFLNDSELILENTKQQKEILEQLENKIGEKQEFEREINEIEKQSTKSLELNKNLQKQIENYIEREKMFNNKLKNELKQLKNQVSQTEKSSSLEENKKLLEEKIQELIKKTELDDILNKLKDNKENEKSEDFINKIENYRKDNTLNKKSIERILEQAKRFMLKNKLEQTYQHIKFLEKKQEQLLDSTNLENEQKEGETTQKNLNDEIKELKDIMKQLEKMNKDLKKEMDIPNLEKEQKEAEKKMNEMEEEFKKEQQNKPKIRMLKRDIKKILEKMKKKMDEFQKAEMKNISMANLIKLKNIVSSLIKLSFEQENLINAFSNSQNLNYNYSKNIKNQNKLKNNFEAIKDSIYELSATLPQIKEKLFEHIHNASIYYEASLNNFQSNQIPTGVQNQNYTLTNVNDIAYQMGLILDNLQEQMGKGKKSGKNNQNLPIMSLPDIIKKQKQLSKKMMKMMKSGLGKKVGEKGKKKPMKGNDYEIITEQGKIKEMLEKLNRGLGNKDMKIKEIKDKMDQLENLLIQKGISPETQQIAQLLEIKLLELKKAKLTQEKDKKRKSKENIQNYSIDNKFWTNPKEKIDKNRKELLIKPDLPFTPFYKEIIKQYFVK